MALRRFQPISPASQWSETLSWTDPRTRKLNTLDGAVLTMALYQYDRSTASGWHRGGDYGWPPRGWGDVPIVSAQTQDDGSGPFFILPDLLHAQFIFPAGTLSNLCQREALLIAWATVNGATDEITRAVIPVSWGPRTLPMPTGAGLINPATNGRVAVADRDYTASPRDAYIALTGLSAPRTITLPFASAYRTGQPIFIADESGLCSPDRLITIAAQGSDGIGGPDGAESSVTMGSSYQKLAFNSLGSNLWTLA